MTARTDYRLQWLAITVAAGANRGSTMLMGTALAVYIGRQGSPLAVGLVASTFFFGQMVFAPFWGAIADITGRRRAVLLVTALLATLAVIPLMIVDSVAMRLAWRGIFAVFIAGFLPVMLAIVSYRGGTTNRGRSIGLFSSAQALGFTAGQFLAGVLLGLLFPAALFGIVAGVAGLVFLAGIVIRDPTPTPAVEPTLGELVYEIKRRLLPEAANREHLRVNGLQWLYLATLLRNMTVIGTGSLLPVYVVSSMGLTEFVMGALLALNPGAQMVFMWASGELADRFGRKPLIVGGMAASSVFGLLMAAAVLPGTPFLRTAVGAVGMLVLAGGFSALHTGSISFIGDVAPLDRESELIGLRYTARGLGGVLGPALYGIAAGLSSYEATFVVGSLLAVAGTVLCWRFLVESHEASPARDGPVSMVE